MKKKWNFCSVELFFREGKFNIQGLWETQGTGFRSTSVPIEMGTDLNAYISTKEHKLPYRRHNKKWKNYTSSPGLELPNHTQQCAWDHNFLFSYCECNSFDR